MATHAHDFGRASALPLPAVLASIPSYPRPVIERLVARLIDHLDHEDGDADLEDTEGQLSWMDDRGRWLCAVSFATEDDEDDDPQGQCDEDGCNTTDGIPYLHGLSHGGAGCPISDGGI